MANINGIWEEKTFFQKLLFTVLLMSGGLLLSTMISMPLAVMIFGLEADVTTWFGKEDLVYANGLRFIQLFTAVGTFLLPAIFLQKAFSIQLNWKETAPVKGYVFGLMVMLFAFPLSSMISEWTNMIPLPGAMGEWIKAQQVSSENLLEQFLDMPSVGFFLFNMLVLAILPAVAEELLFRSTLMPVLLQRFGKWAAIALNGLIFAVVHQQFQHLIGIFLLGSFLAWVWFRYKDVKLIMALHLFNNGLLVILIYLQVDLEALTFASWHYLIFMGLIFLCLRAMRSPF